MKLSLTGLFGKNMLLRVSFMSGFHFHRPPAMKMESLEHGQGSLSQHVYEGLSYATVQPEGLYDNIKLAC